MRASLTIRAAVLVCVACFAGGTAAAEKVVWKGVPVALLKVDDQPAKIWDVFVSEKHKTLILVQLGSRFLMLDTAAKEIRELPADSLSRKGNELHGELPVTKSGNESDAKRKLLPSADWSDRSAGRLRIFKLRLTEEGRVIEVQLPQQGDLRKFY